MTISRRRVVGLPRGSRPRLVRRERELIVPYTEALRLTGDLVKLGATTDDVMPLVLKNGQPVISRTLALD